MPRRSKGLKGVATRSTLSYFLRFFQSPVLDSCITRAVWYCGFLNYKFSRRCFITSSEQLPACIRSLRTKIWSNLFCRYFITIIAFIIEENPKVGSRAIDHCCANNWVYHRASVSTRQEDTIQRFFSRDQ